MLRAVRARELSQVAHQAWQRSLSVSAVAYDASARRKEDEPRFNYTANPFGEEPDPDHVHYRRVTARELSKRTSPPRRVKMLVRDFIDDCLYNPHYGYFSTQAYIFDPDTAGADGSDPKRALTAKKDPLLAVSRTRGFDFPKMRSTSEFEDEVARRYGVLEGADVNMSQGGPGRQIWHTPTELFKPWYGRAVANYVVAQARARKDERVVIYEMGAGNGTLMRDVLDFIASEHPDLYDRTEYKVIEISDQLHTLQQERASSADGERSHTDKVEVINKSIFDWKTVEDRPCFFLAMEVLDNFAHDIVRYTRVEQEPVQCVVAVDGSGDYNEIYEPVTDPIIRRYLEMRQIKRPPAIHPVLAASKPLRQLVSVLPFAANMSPPEYIPTKQLMLLDVLRAYFPQHRLLMSDFSTLPDAIPGVNAPVVQTRYDGETVPCTTYLVQPGFFDIFFPTDFDQLRGQYERVMSSSDAKSTAQIMDHAAFLREWAEHDQTRLRDGSNPLFDSYENAKFLVTPVHR